MRAFEVLRVGFSLALVVVAASCGGERGERAPARDGAESALPPAVDAGSGSPAPQVTAKADQTSPADRTPAGSGHAPAGVVPGSYDDWCGEHLVPESLCTRCNPSLIAAFKATGDWCAEHGLPESQCLACNPDLKIVRPARTGGG